MGEYIGEVLLTRRQIQAKVRSLARQISRDYEGEEILLVTILKGGVFFLTDLSKHITVPIALDFLGISSYGPEKRGGEVRFTKDLDTSIRGRHVLIVEDIVDTGLTLGYIQRNLLNREPASLRTCVLLDRPYRRIIDIPIHYRGFELPDQFVVGYGLDWREKYRNLSYIAVLHTD
jgi:hypoxanthine phosphoribosyltransferase